MTCRRSLPAREVFVRVYHPEVAFCLISFDKHEVAPVSPLVHGILSSQVGQTTQSSVHVNGLSTKIHTCQMGTYENKISLVTTICTICPRLYRRNQEIICAKATIDHVAYFCVHSRATLSNWTLFLMYWFATSCSNA